MSAPPSLLPLLPLLLHAFERGGAREQENPAVAGLSTMRRRGLEPPRAIRSQGPQPCSHSPVASDMALHRQMLRRARTSRTYLARRSLPRVLPLGLSDRVARAGSAGRGLRPGVSRTLA